MLQKSHRKHFIKLYCTYYLIFFFKARYEYCFTSTDCKISAQKQLALTKEVKGIHPNNLKYFATFPSLLLLTQIIPCVFQRIWASLVQNKCSISKGILYDLYQRKIHTYCPSKKHHGLLFHMLNINMQKNCKNPARWTKGNGFWSIPK